MRRNLEPSDERDRQQARERDEAQWDALEREWGRRRFADRADYEIAVSDFATKRERER